jgi:predicted nucleic acid-binding protein
MEILIYPDTNFYLDYLEDRSDKMRPLGEFAFSVLKRTFKCEFKIVMSYWVIKELEQHIAKERMARFIGELESMNKLIMVAKDYDDAIKAKSLPTHYSDAMHIVLAMKAGAEFFVTRNIQHYLNMGHLIKVVLPENL